jgi:hypothetical protein
MIVMMIYTMSLMMRRVLMNDGDDDIDDDDYDDIDDDDIED